MRVLAAALVAAFFMTAIAAAQIFPRTVQIPCSGPAVLPELLARDWGEAPAAQGVADGALVQFWSNAESRSWTILLVSPDGSVCALASGEDWMAVDPPEGEGL